MSEIKRNYGLERRVLNAFFRSAYQVDEDIRWRRYRFNRDMLERQLSSLCDKALDAAFLDELSARFGLTVLRVDPLKLSIYGFEKTFERQAIAEGIGAAGVQFFPTRQSATRSAFEAAREAAYFGAGPAGQQFFDCPVARVMHQLDPDAYVPENGTILRDLREGFASDEMIFDILNEDNFFQNTIHDASDFEAFQKNLRNAPLSAEFVEKCSAYFDRRFTIGVRDTMRWMLGSRHPWFNWNCAKSHILSAFEANRDTDFNTPQIVYYAYEPTMDDVELNGSQAANLRICRAFASMFSEALSKENPSIVSVIESRLEKLAQWILDIHHDYPDFDLESAGSFGPATHIDFLNHSIQNKVTQDLLGQEFQMRRNLNMRSHFAARGLDKSLLSGLSDIQKEVFFAVLDEQLAQYDKNHGINGEMYKRIPCLLFLIQDLGNPVPGDNERLLDAFDLSEMTQLEHASYMRSFPEISEKLVVFFALTLRHMIETEHVPDLKPRDFVKDFMLLGLWGTRTPNIRVNLYVDKSLDERDLANKLTRSEIKFVGTEQVETHPVEHIREEARALRLAVSHFAPLIEPSILRNLGTFTMAMEEFRDQTHVFKLDPLSIMHYAVDLIREFARYGIKGSVTDVMTIFEYLMDFTYDGFQHGLDKTAKLLNKVKKS